MAEASEEGRGEEQTSPFLFFISSVSHLLQFMHPFFLLFNPQYGSESLGCVTHIQYSSLWLSLCSTSAAAHKLKALLFADGSVAYMVQAFTDAIVPNDGK